MPEEPENKPPPELPAELRKFLEEFSKICEAWTVLAENLPKEETLPAFVVEPPGLAGWLEKAVLAVETFADFGTVAEQVKRHYEESNPLIANHARLWLDHFDFALTKIYQRLDVTLRVRAKSTNCVDLMCEAVMRAIGDSSEAAELIRRCEEAFPESGRAADGKILAENFVDSFAWDTYQRVDELDEFADEFPDHIRFAAIQMHAWPMLQYPQTENRKRFQELAARFDLGAEYPLDASASARFHPRTPMVRYLDQLMYKLHGAWKVFGYAGTWSEKAIRERLWETWSGRRYGTPDESVLAILEKCNGLPWVTKATADQWAREVVVPIIMATDAKGPETCTEWALREIWRQRDVKSTAIFKSRLLAAVSATLGRIARPVAPGD